jgi:hypothetical protein
MKLKYHIHSVWFVLMLGLLCSEVRAQSVTMNPFAGMTSLPNGMQLNSSMPIEVAPSSKVWLEGSANIINFECAAGKIESKGVIHGLDTTAAIGGHGQVVLEVSIPVQQLNCGKSGINRDMKNTLNADKHPYIVYKLDANRLISARPDGEHPIMEIETMGGLTISGLEREELITITGQFIGDWRFRVRGVHTIQMSEYNLTPPSPMMGLIKVHDELKVHFDVILTLKMLTASN